MRILFVHLFYSLFVFSFSFFFSLGFNLSLCFNLDLKLNKINFLFFSIESSSVSDFLEKYSFQIPTLYRTSLGNTYEDLVSTSIEATFVCLFKRINGIPFLLSLNFYLNESHNEFIIN